MKANGFLAGHDAAWLINWANKKMTGKASAGGGVPEDSRFASLSLDKRLEIYDNIQAAAKRGQTAIDAQTKAAYDSHKGTLELGIQTGEVSSPRTILSDPTLTDAHKADLISALRTRQGDAMATGEAVRLFSQGSLTVDPYDPKGKKTVDNVWNEVSKAAPEQAQATLENLVSQTGTVPQGVVNQIRSGLTSGDLSVISEAAQLAARLHTVDPSALETRDGGSGIRDAAVSYQHYVDNVGMSPEQAAQRLADQRDPEKVKARASLMGSKPIKDFVKNNATESAVRDIFDPGVFGFDPKLGQTPSEAAAMVGEYKSILEESIFDANGDTDAARVLAADRFRRRYGPSALTLAGDGVVTRLPPETVYPPASDGSYEYIRKQAIEALAQEGVTADEVFLQSSTMTDNDYRSRKPPRYELYYRSGDQLERFMLPFYAVPPQDAGTIDLSAARERRDQNRQDLLDGRNREQTLDNFLDGPPMPTQPQPQGSINVEPPKPQTPASQIQDQRQQLFNDARDNGTLSPQDALSGNDPIFGAR
ncbi:MAG: hypothetical protein WBA88_19085 [Pseudaminobacter sp.]